MSPGTPSMPLLPFSMNFTSPTGSSSSGIQKRYQKWAEERFVSFNTADSLVFIFYQFSNLISGVIVSVGSSPGHVKPKTIKLVFAASPISTQLWQLKAKTGWIRIRILCLSRAHVGGRFGQRSRLVKVDFAFSLVKNKVQVAL